jgi:hypothetical protein
MPLKINPDCKADELFDFPTVFYACASISIAAKISIKKSLSIPAKYRFIFKLCLDGSFFSKFKLNRRSVPKF